MSELLFVYGSLRPGRAPAEIAAVAARLEPVGDATVRGRVIDLGAYPGLVEGNERVPGLLMLVPDDVTLHALDAYEGEEFPRKRVIAEAAYGEVECWIYAYAGETP